MKLVSKVVAVLFAASVAACSNAAPTITIVSDPTTITAGANSCVKLTITGSVDGTAFSPAMDPLPQESTNYGVLIDPTAGGSGLTTIQGNVTGTTVTLQLCATDNTPGMATVMAQVTDSYNVTVTASANVDFTAPMGDCDGGSCLAAKTIAFSCTDKNIDAFETQETSMVTGCSAVAKDMNGNQLNASAISFLEEAGTVIFSQSDTDATGEPVFLYYPHQGTNVAPQDVSPLGSATGGEPRWTDPETNVTHNPRDGLVTLVAYAEGDNTQAIGLGTIFAGDPCVDANDNGQCDPGEIFFPSKGANAAYSSTQNVYVWTQTKILWSGGVSLNPQVATVTHTPASLDLDLGQSVTLTFQVVDDNFNALAANDQMYSYITWQPSPAGELALVNSTGTVTMPNTYGIKIDASNDYNITDQTDISSYLQQVTYTIEVTNGECPSNMSGPMTWTMSGTATHVGCTDDMGDDADMDTDPVGGTTPPGGVLYDTEPM